MINLAVVGHQHRARLFQRWLAARLCHQQLQGAACRRVAFGIVVFVDFFKRGVEQLEQREEGVLKCIQPLRPNLFGEQAHIALGSHRGFLQLIHRGGQFSPLQAQGEQQGQKREKTQDRVEYTA